MHAEGAARDSARNKMRGELAWMRKQPKARQAKSKARQERFFELKAKVRYCCFFPGFWFCILLSGWWLALDWYIHTHIASFTTRVVLRAVCGQHSVGPFASGWWYLTEGASLLSLPMAERPALAARTVLGFRRRC